MEKKSLLRTVMAPPPPEDSVRLIEVSEVISLFTGKGLGKPRPVPDGPEDLPEYA